MNDQQIKENLSAITSPTSGKHGRLTNVFGALYRQGFRQIRASYHGYGDSGGVEEVVAYETRDEPNGKQPGTRLHDGEAEAIMDWIEDLLPGGWEIDDGADGDAFIQLNPVGNPQAPDFIRGTITIEHGTHHRETTYDSFEGDSECTQ